MTNAIFGKFIVYLQYQSKRDLEIIEFTAHSKPEIWSTLVSFWFQSIATLTTLKKCGCLPICQRREFKSEGDVKSQRSDG